MAGFFGFGDFAKEGKGVDKDAPQKRGIFLFFELFFRKFSQLIKLNLLYFISIIPTFIAVFFLSGFLSSALVEHLYPVIADFYNLNIETAFTNKEFLHLSIYLDITIRIFVTILFTILWGMGPATCGFTYVLRNYARQEHSWLFSDFFSNAKRNFKQGTIVWLIDLVVFFLLFNAYRFYSSQSGVISIIKYFIVTLLLIYTIMHFYIYQLIITFELTLKQLYKNSLILSLGKLPRSFFILFTVLFVTLILPYCSLYASAFTIFIILFIFLVLMILLSLTGFLINFFVYPVIKKELLTKVDPVKYVEN